MQIHQLKTELDKEAIEVANLEERKIMIKFELEELDRNKEELMRSLDDKKKRQMELLQPTIDKLNSQLVDVQADIQQQKEYKKREIEAKAGLLAKIEECKRSMEVFEAAKTKKRQQLLKVRYEPEKMRKQFEGSQKMNNQIQKESDECLESTTAADSQIQQLMADRKEFDIRRLKNSHDLDMLRSFVQKRQARGDDLKRFISIENDVMSQVTEQIAEKDLMVQQGKLEMRHAMESLLSYNKLYEDQKKKYERHRRKLDSVQSILIPLETQYNDKLREMENIQSNSQKQNKILAELKQDVDIFISSYLRQEKLDDDQSAELQEIQLKFSQLETTISSLLKQERELERQIASLSAQRERISREHAKLVTDFREARDDLNVKDLVISDYSKKLAESQSKLKSGNAMYEIVKSQRNKYAHMLQASNQMLVEMKEKIKIFQNEVEILRAESFGKDKNIAEETRACTNVQYTRDTLRSELNRNANIMREKKEKVSRQFMEIDKLNSIINTAEKEMIRIRAKYTKAVDNRNATGIQLIDHNDELCILHEKFNIQANIIEKGTQELQARQDEMRLLEAEMRDMTWKIDVQRKNAPSLQVYTDAEIKLKSLKEDLEIEKKKNEKLCQQLENPNPDQIRARARILEGNDPDEDQLVAKIEVLQDRLNEKREMILERNLILDEVTSLSDNLRSKAAEGRTSTLDLAQNINEYQSKWVIVFCVKLF